MTVPRQTTGSDEPENTQTVQQVLLDDYHRLVRSNLVGAPLAGVVFAIIMLRFNSPARLVAAMAILAVITVFSLLLLSNSLRDGDVAETRRFALLNSFGGLAWGGYFWLLMPESPTAQLYLAVLIVVALAANVVETAPIFSSFLAFHVVFTAIVIAAFVFSGHPDSRGVWQLILLAAVYFLFVGKVLNSHAVERAELMVQNDELIGGLNAINDDLERRTGEDRLTGLANRLGLERFMADALVQRNVDGTKLAVLYIDLDGFKKVNDEHGHPVGDELLFRVARKLEMVMGGRGCISRYGGDEFVGVMTCVLASEADEVAKRIVEALGQPIVLPRRQVRIGASVGVAISPQRTIRERELLREADRALYRAKTAGGSRFHRDPQPAAAVEPADLR